MDHSAAITVSTLVNLLQEVVEDNFVDILVQGELSNVSKPSSGHYYFTLKDKTGQLKCAMFRSQARALRFKPVDGLSVVCRARASVYPQRGELQLIVSGIEPEGVGGLQLAFEQLKQKLENEGLFSAKLKQPLPNFPKTIGIVTSATGAAIHDIINVLRRRSAGVKVLLHPVRVQGEGAADEIATALSELSNIDDVDVIIVGRGGGSREDLWAFNEEVVARAIVAARIPIISAVGHEVDVSISDLVADLRAPTPSAAAELVVKNSQELEHHLDQLTIRLAAQMRGRLTLLNNNLDGVSKRLRSPVDKVKLQRARLQQTQVRLQQVIATFIDHQRHQFSLLASRLESLSPLAVLSRGYAIVKLEKTAEVIHAPECLSTGDRVMITFADGEAVATVETVTTKKEK